MCWPALAAGVCLLLIVIDGACSLNERLNYRLNVVTKIRVEITFDPDKDAANVAKHALSLALARDLEWDTLQWTEDTRRTYGETRMAGYAFMGERLYGVVYVVRGDVLRVISLRKANQREVKSYVENAIKFQS